MLCNVWPPGGTVVFILVTRWHVSGVTYICVLASYDACLNYVEKKLLISIKTKMTHIGEILIEIHRKYIDSLEAGLHAD